MEAKFEITDHGWALDLENGWEEYIFSCLDSVDTDADVETETGIYYCGCSNCYNREVIAYLAPRIIQGYIDGKIKLNDS